MDLWLPGRGDKAVLTPIDEAYALRPSLAHMSSTRNEADAKAKAAAEDEEDEKPSEPQHIRVCCLLLCAWAEARRVTAPSTRDFRPPFRAACAARNGVTPLPAASLACTYDRKASKKRLAACCVSRMHCMKGSEDTHVRVCRCMCRGGRQSGSRNPA